MADFDEEYAAPKLSLKCWLRLTPYFKRYRLIFMIMLLGIAATGLIDISQPLFQRYAINHFVMPKSTAGLPIFALLYLLTFVAQSFLVRLFCKSSGKIEMLLGRDLKHDAFLNLQKLDMSFYNRNPVGRLIARVMSDTGRIALQSAWGLVDLFWSTFYIVGVFIVMFTLNMHLASLVLLTVPPMALLTVYFQNKILKLTQKQRKTNSYLTGAFNEGIIGVKTTKSLVIEDIALNDFKEISSQMRKVSVRTKLLSGIYLPLITFSGSVATALVLSNGGNMIIGSLLEFGTFSAFISYAVSIFEPIQQLASVISEVFATQINIDRVMNLIEQKPLITDTPEVVAKYGDAFIMKKENWDTLNGDVQFSDVTFSYPDGSDSVLEHFNLSVKAGSTVAIVGETGAGKSTLINLLCRFFEPQSGKILIDGKDIRERSAQWIHQNLGYVLQNPHLFSGSIRDNIRFANPDASDDAVIEALKFVCADRLLEKFPEGLDYDVGEGGDKLSTGEKQLISFARAIISNPRLFLLDEATSSVDTETEKIIQQAVSNVCVGRTSFVVAHRLSTIKNADLIIVVENGRIIEQGTHSTLIAQKSAYYQLYTNQLNKESASGIL